MQSNISEGFAVVDRLVKHMATREDLDHGEPSRRWGVFSYVCLFLVACVVGYRVRALFRTVPRESGG
jgi:hypothetical protein